MNRNKRKNITFILVHIFDSKIYLVRCLDLRRIIYIILMRNNLVQSILLNISENLENKGRGKQSLYSCVTRLKKKVLYYPQ